MKTKRTSGILKNKKDISNSPKDDKGQHRAEANKENVITSLNILMDLKKITKSIRSEPLVDKERKVAPVKKEEVEFTLPTHMVGDPFSIFHRERERGFSSEDQSRFNSGEHIWLGDQGFKEACEAISENYNNYITIRRGEGHGNERFSYGEIVALSGDFYGAPGDLFFEKPALLSWLWEENDTSDLKKYFKKEIEAIRKQMEGTEIKYPDYNIQFWWNAKNYTELAKNNESHFGWHNVNAYCLYHTWALDIAIEAGVTNDDTLWRKSLYYNGFADHFLTDAFAAGHLRVPRKEIRGWATRVGLSDTQGGFLSKLLHDQDGHRHSDHTQGEERDDGNDGLRVKNSVGKVWNTFCDGQLFIKSDAESEHIRQPIEAVKASVCELFEAKKTLKMPQGIFKAIKHVPFPHPDEPALVKKFNPENNNQIKKWVESAKWYAMGVNEKNVKKLFSALPELMENFRTSVKKEASEFVERIPAEYIHAFLSLS